MTLAAPPEKRSQPITIASILFLFLGIGIAAADPFIVAYISYYHTAPFFLFTTFLDDNTPISMRLGLNGVIVLGIVNTATSVLGAVAGFWLWRSLKKGGKLGMALLPVDLFFAYGFNIPILWIVPPLRSVLLAAGWRTLR
jgi:hypothetical protein